MHEKLDHEEVLQTLDRLIQRSEDVLGSAEEELRQARTALLTLTVREHVLGPVSKEEESRREVALSNFRELTNRVRTEQERLKRLRAAREEWETGLPTSLHSRFEDLLSS